MYSNSRIEFSAAPLLKDIEGLIELGVTSASKGFWINVHENVRLYARSLGVVSIRTVPTEYRYVEGVPVSYVERRGPEDITHCVLADESSELCVFCELGGHLSRAVREFIYQHHNMAMERLSSQTLREKHQGLILNGKTGQTKQKAGFGLRHRNARQFGSSVSSLETSSGDVVPDRNSVGAEIANAVVAPIPSASVNTSVAVHPGPF